MIAILIIAGCALFVVWWLRMAEAQSRGGCAQSLAAVVFAVVGLLMALSLIPLAAVLLAGG